MRRSSKAFCEALFDLPGESSTKEARAGALEALSSLAAGDGASENRAVWRFLRDPEVDAADKADAVASLLPGDSGWAAFCTVLSRDGAWDRIEPIAAKYREAVDRATGTERALIESARPLSGATRDAVAEAWRAARGASRVIVSERTMPSLLGGFRFTAGSTRYDLSALGKLDRLRAALAAPLPRGRAPIGGIE